jgi:SHS family lactate transporter-like MFS transporter
MSFLAAWSAWVLDAFDFTVFVLVMRDITTEFGVSYTSGALSITLTLLFRLVGGLAAGSVADRIGRKAPLAIAIAWFALCDAGVAFAPGFGWILALRTLFGLGMGAQWASGATLAMENWPERSRGIASGVLQGSWAIGYFLAALVYRTVLPMWGWRALFIVAAVPALVVLPLLLAVPESQAWKEARASHPHYGLRDFVADGLVGRIAWACLLWAFAFGVYYGLTNLYPVLLRGELAQGVAGVARLVMLFNVGMMVGSIACGAAASRWGPVLALAVPVLVLLPVLPFYTGLAPGWLDLAAVLAGALGAGISGVTPMLLTQLFPARARARSVAVVYHVGALLAAVTAPLIAMLAERGGLGLARSITFVSGASAVLMVGTLLLRPRGAVPEETLAARPASPGAARAASTRSE